MRIETISKIWREFEKCGGNAGRDRHARTRWRRTDEPPAHKEHRRRLRAARDWSGVRSGRIGHTLRPALREAEASLRRRQASSCAFLCLTRVRHSFFNPHAEPAGQRQSFGGSALQFLSAGALAKADRSMARNRSPMIGCCSNPVALGVLVVKASDAGLRA